MEPNNLEVCLVSSSDNNINNNSVFKKILFIIFLFYFYFLFIYNMSSLQKQKQRRNIMKSKLLIPILSLLAVLIMFYFNINYHNQAAKAIEIEQKYNNLLNKKDSIVFVHDTVFVSQSIHTFIKDTIYIKVEKQQEPKQVFLPINNIERIHTFNFIDSVSARYDTLEVIKEDESIQNIVDVMRWSILAFIAMKEFEINQ